MLNTHIGPYQIIREIGQDSIGHSFEAVHEARNKTVTLKYLRAETVTPEILSHLYSEVKILALLDHPQIARVFGIVRRDGHLYLITEFLQGETLETISKQQGRMQPAIALALFQQMMAGVAFAHTLGVMHGDLKPSNVLVTDADPPVKLLNFALAHVFGFNPVGSRNKDSRYIAPEQIEGDPPDARSDIYSLGMMLYELLVGKSPFDVYGASEDLVSKAQGQFIPVLPSLIVPDLPKWLDEFVLRMLAISPSDRFQSVRAMARVLEVEIAHATKMAPPERQGLSPQHWTDYIGFSKNPVIMAGNWSFDSIKRAILGIAKFPVRRARVIANRAKAWAEYAFMTLEPAGQRISSASSYFLRTPKPLLESFKKRLPERVKTNWRRYAQVTSLVVLILVESFYFHGANISSLIDSRLLSGPSLNESVDSMFARINQEASKTDHRKISKRELTTVVERQDPSRQLVQNPAIPPSVRVRSQPSQRLSDNRPHTSPSIAANSQKETNVPLLDVHNVKEQKATGPARTTQDTTPKSELNVKWEN
jgi:serine/threonine protein kinase